MPCDDGNRLTNRGAQTFTYDDNGNLTSDGQRSYTWDARNRLTGITGATQASFSYDAFGRRTQKSVGGSTTSYVYDGGDAVQEVAGGGVFANLLTGGVDEVFTRTEAGGASTLLHDGLGSTLALLDSSGNTQTSYTYEPFGQTTQAGTGNGNASKFTGREDDGTGLYYYHARYYSPASQRFISEDPIGFAGGDVNLYAYVGNDPANYTDPSGHSKLIKIVRRFGEYLRPSRTGSVREAQNAYKRGADIIAPDRRSARQIIEGATKDMPDAGDILHHEAHPRRLPDGSPGSKKGRLNHYQADNLPNQHVFYRQAAFFLAPNSMALSGRKDTTPMQIVSGALWDIAETIDPVGITDAFNWYFGLDE